MRIHCDHTKTSDLFRAESAIADKAPDVVVHLLSIHGSRSRKVAYEVALRGEGARHTRRPNTGISGANNDEYAATHDDWGHFIAALYQNDPTAKIGPYKSRTHFHVVTKDKYRP
jgi:hypothetical protein